MGVGEGVTLVLNTCCKGCYKGVKKGCYRVGQEGCCNGVKKGCYRVCQKRCCNNVKTVFTGCVKSGVAIM